MTQTNSEPLSKAKLQIYETIYQNQAHHLTPQEVRHMGLELTAEIKRLNNWTDKDGSK